MFTSYVKLPEGNPKTTSSWFVSSLPSASGSSGDLGQSLGVFPGAQAQAGHSYNDWAWNPTHEAMVTWDSLWMLSSPHKSIIRKKKLVKKYGGVDEKMVILDGAAPEIYMAFGHITSLLRAKDQRGINLPTRSFCLHYPIIVAKPCGYHVYIYIYMYMAIKRGRLGNHLKIMV